MRAILTIVPLSLLAACGGGGSNAPISGSGQPAELVYCRTHVDSPFSRTEIRSADARGLADRRVLDKSGLESGVRVHQDGIRLVFARQLRVNDPRSREIFVGTRDGSAAEVRLTVDSADDDGPCWSPAGDRILFSSDRLGSGRRLYLMSPDGADVTPLRDDGSEQLEADWSAAAGDRIVFARIDRGGSTPRAELWLIDAGGREMRRLTDGGQSGGGDREPAFSPDGTAVAFARLLDDELSILMSVDVQSGTVTELSQPAGEDRSPRWSPHGDRLYFTRSRPTDGLAGLRLWAADASGRNPVLVFVDERFEFPGFDPLPDMAPAPAAAFETTDVGLEGALLEIVLGRPTGGAPESILRNDGSALRLATQLFDHRERAGVNLRIELPVAVPEDMVELHVEVTAGLSVIEGDAVLRLSLSNAVARREDTVVESTPPDTGFCTLRFATQSLAHVTRGKRIDLQVIGDLPRDVPGELAIDHVAVKIRKRAGAE